MELTHIIDPGFVNRRLVQTIIGDLGMEVIDERIRQIPPLPEGLYEARIDHDYSQVALAFCEARKVPALGEFLIKENCHLFCSTEQFIVCDRVYEATRASSKLQPAGNAEYDVILEYSTSHIRSDTLRAQLARGGTLSCIALLHLRTDNTLYFHPLVMGFPWLSHKDNRIAGWAMWRRHEFYEQYIEDFDEFNKVKSTPKPTSCDPMKDISEAAFKLCLAEVLGGGTRKDWGGETSDHFTSHLRLNGKRVSGAFLLKGPSRFAPMDLNHLGKKNDQIFRLSQEPADVLFVQHCHDIEPAVRATLRAFAVQPGRPRRYCFIDGRDSLWLLQAYNLYERARELSRW